jgi:serine protease inhibitor
MSDEAILEAQIDFSLQLLRELNLNSDISSVVSPISVILALSLAYAGAEKETRDEFEDVFSKGKFFKS